MSDGFDKEAEREKLREKLADDEEKREHTQRMSELLLQGATMTNRHCDDCGDPIFRKDGQEFCPTCHTADAEDAEDGESAGSSGTAAGQTPGAAGGSATTPGGGASPTATSENGTAGTGRVDQGSAETSPEPPVGTPESPVGTPESPAGLERAARTPESTATGSDPTADATAATATADATAATATAGSGSVADARASLTRTLNRFAAAAAETDDPRRARDHLQAAREAAEALAALD
ncbi:Sjogren's syndrome/scleroderma autoantigen 1 family protein [Halorubrum sp. Boch-26]|uniref:Sjogren's syndrome/scleroderma autoantigen 1 family protein n=1 Tax=Halorubrum sp. Boch-26 TaxID=2994426 RepID=UPI002469438B|nr:Sjogren's syndrome/scleroderma autoantigen 1 family protein [Halorubrum sp. Boch-26]